MTRSIRWLLRAAFYCASGLVGLASLAPSAALPTVSVSDKAQHVIAYAVLGLLGTAAYQRRATRVILGLAVYGTALEFLQTFSPGRSPDVADAIADIIGASLGAGAAIALLRVTLIAIDKISGGTTECRPCSVGGGTPRIPCAQQQDRLHHLKRA